MTVAGCLEADRPPRSLIRRGATCCARVGFAILLLNGMDRPAVVGGGAGVRAEAEPQYGITKG